MNLHHQSASRPLTGTCHSGITLRDFAVDRTLHSPPIFSDNEQVMHRTTNPVFDVCKPVLPLTTTTTLQGTLKESLRQCVLQDHVARPDQLMSAEVSVVLRVWQPCFVQSHWSQVPECLSVCLSVCLHSL